MPEPLIAATSLLPSLLRPRVLHYLSTRPTFNTSGGTTALITAKHAINYNILKEFNDRLEQICVKYVFVRWYELLFCSENDGSLDGVL